MQPRPSVSLWAFPSVIYGRTLVTFSWSSANASACNVGGPFGSIFQYVDYYSTGLYSVTCWGAGGTTTAYTNVFWGGAGLASQTNNNLLGKNTKAIAASGAIPDLKHLGIDLNKKRTKFTRGDLNKDGFEDLVIVDALQQKAFIVLGQAGKYPAINKAIANVTSFEQIKSIQVSPQGAAGDIVVTMENRQ